MPISSSATRTLAALILCLGCSSTPPTALELSFSITAGESAPFVLAPLPYRLDAETLPFEAGPAAKAHWGTTASGAGYRIEIPDEWNGDLMLSLRGGGELCNAETGEGCSLGFGPAPLRPHLVARGVAWATTTYSDYRLAPALRAREGLDLVELFEEQFGSLRRVFISGRSFGGVATLTALEFYPDRFAGALPMCTGLPVEGFTSFYDINLVALALAAPSDPELAAVLTDFALPVDSYDWRERVAPRIAAALGLGPDAAPTAEAAVLREVVRRTTGGDRPTFDVAFAQSVGPMLFHYLGIGVPADVGSRSFIDNGATQYRWESGEGEALTSTEADLNRRLPRFSCGSDVCFEPGPAFAEGPFGGFPRHTGRIETPTLLLQDIGDLTAPFIGAVLYAERVAAQGRANLLVQRALRETKHCGFSDAELSEAFDDLVEWVETGKRPKGDDFGNVAEVSSPDFGCQFTRGAREDDTAFAEVCR